MGYTMHRRTTQTRRLIERNLANHHLPFFGLSHCAEYGDQRPGTRQILRSTPFHTLVEAQRWQHQTRQERRDHQREAEYSTIDTSALYDCTTKTTSPRFVVRFVHRTGPEYRRSADTWALQEAEARERRQQMKRLLERRSFQGGVKPYRRAHHRARRHAGKMAEHLAVRGDIDGAESVNLNVHTTGILWDVW